MNEQEYQPQDYQPVYGSTMGNGKMPKKHDSGFGKGMATGIIATLLVVAIFAGGIRAFSRLDERKSEIENAVEPEKTGNVKDTLVQDDVTKKEKEIADLIDQYYYEEIDQKAIAEGIYSGMVEGLGDPYSAYFTAEEYAAFNESATGTYCGIGVVLTQNAETNIVTILHVYPGTPAEEAGLKDGDVLAKVKDIDAASVELTELTAHIKGEEGTTVHLEIVREGESDYLEFDVERRPITVPTLESQMLEGNVGFIRITEFSDSTSKQFETAVKELQTQGMKAMIVDLRDNPGGVLQGVCDILDQILPQGLVVYTEDKYGNRSNYDSDKSCLDIPMAVLINGNSASASEIFAGAIKDYEYGTLIGTKSFGKGIVQTIIPLADGSAVKVTMAKYFTPKGNYIHGVGIEPDIELEYEYQGEDETYNPMHDNQVLKALEVLKK